MSAPAAAATPPTIAPTGTEDEEGLAALGGEVGIGADREGDGEDVGEGTGDGDGGDGVKGGSSAGGVQQTEAQSEKSEKAGALEGFKPGGKPLPRAQ